MLSFPEGKTDLCRPVTILDCYNRWYARRAKKPPLPAGGGSHRRAGGIGKEFGGEGCGS